MGWLLSTGRRTVTSMLRAGRLCQHDHWSPYYRLFSHAVWNEFEMWRRWVHWVVSEFCPEGPLLSGGDDTLLKHRGQDIYGLDVFRDAVLSSRSRMVLSFGHHWVVMFLLVQFPLWPHRWMAVPINARLHLKGSRRTSVDLMKEMMEQLAKWLPQREIVYVVDGGYSTLAGSLPKGCHLTGRLRSDAATYELPPPVPPKRRGRPAQKGKKMRKPCEIAADKRTTWKKIRVGLYGEHRGIEVHSYVAIWDNVLKQPIRVILSRDPKTKEVACFLTTDVDRSIEQTIEHYGARYSVERMFEDAKQHLGVEDPQVQSQRSVERMAPVAFLMYGAVVCWYATQGHHLWEYHVDPWYKNKLRASFQDMLAAARALSLQETISDRSTPQADIEKSPLSLRKAVAQGA